MASRTGISNTLYSSLSLFSAHAVPLLLNLMENHDYHVRMVLLEHLLHFAPLCPESELTSSLLPEVQELTQCLVSSVYCTVLAAPAVLHGGL